MPVPCLRPDAPTFEHETEIVLESPYGGSSQSYDCRIEFTVAADDTVHIDQVDVWFGSRQYGRWQDCRNVLESEIAESLHEQAQAMDEMLRDKVSVEVEDWRAERAKEACRDRAEWRDEAADARGHALREKIAEGRR